MESYNFDNESDCIAICSSNDVLASTCCCFRDKASLANSSSPFSKASCARRYHSSASWSAWSFWRCCRFWVAMTSAYDCLIVTKSFWRSSTAWFSTFSGSSIFPRTLLMFASATLLKRSKKFIWREVVGLARVATGRRAVLGAKAAVVATRSAARIGAISAWLVCAAAWRLWAVVAKRFLLALGGGRCAAAEIFAAIYSLRNMSCQTKHACASLGRVF